MTITLTPTTRLAAAVALALALPLAQAAKPARKAESAAKPLTEAQLAVAQQVLTGEAECEAGKKLKLHPVDNKPGHFVMKHGKASYTMTPEETSTGAVRLEDKKAGIVWIQIPAKSMLMNAKAGQRLADDCRLGEQLKASAQ